jgi:MOSC domain-containing protein YiiM
MSSVLEAIYVCDAAGQPMRRCNEVRAIAERGLDGDRYLLGTGYYSQRDDCQVTLVESEALDRMAARFDVRVGAGEHRRNLVTRGIELRRLEGKRLHLGDVILQYERPRPPCAYMGRLTQPVMTRALGEGSGICARVIRSGRLFEGMGIEIVSDPSAPRPRTLP